MRKRVSGMPGPASSQLPTRIRRAGNRLQRAMSPGKRRQKAQVCGEEKRGLRGRVHGEEGGAANPTTDLLRSRWPKERARRHHVPPLSKAHQQVKGLGG